MRPWLKNLFIPHAGNNFTAWLFHERALFLYVLVAIFLKITLVYLGVYFPQTNLFATITSSDMVALINQERTSQGLSALVVDEKLNTAAGLKVTDMITNQYFAHQSPSGLSPWYFLQKAGYNFKMAGENLAINFSDPQTLVLAWMQSSSHRANILNPAFTDLGLAVKSGELDGNSTVFCALVFGQKAATATVPAEITQKQPTELTPAGQQPAVTEKTPSETNFVEKVQLPAITGPEQKIVDTDGHLTPVEKLVLVEIKKTQPPPGKPQNRLQPKVLGAFTSKSDEIIKSLYIYFSTLILMAAFLTLLVRANAQNLFSIILAILLLILNMGLLYV
ncbi:MAG: hypothetical protein COU85_01220 [Candidatus Portnoybacteria bacterium CG10_big_fil_rev_8_21_14_0_10_44_7]|uniref:SCP domain-containing protein n=1 Tax=Candidatus Portnoybacteria bacterium CG10_big_fil_rev_8_21_14_0_10_44_7 TaxID=1974816 RepID=A0A2M8KIZ0_9BACT|nr:MAG: hypothetical protein COU85_01220 [Candidatus Portnoybacteria bacterium CG10_big_fil_rev_8_21_14_0_10_44_7]